MKALALWTCAICLGGSSLLYGQEITLHGTVIDSVTRQPLPFVAITAKGRKTSTISMEDGHFRYPCFFGDTVLFMCLGYEQQRVIARNSGNIRVELKEVPKLLESVTIYSRYKPQGYEQWKLAVNLPQFQNPGAQPTNNYMQTVGVGGGMGVDFDYFSKEKREKRKLQRVHEELEKTKVFRATVQDPETKRYLMNLFKLSEGEYTAKLAAFNQHMPEAQRAKTKTEVIDLLIGFFALK